MTIIGYISSYYSLASSVPLGLLNYFLIGWLNGELDKFYVQSWQGSCNMQYSFVIDADAWQSLSL
jgi:hypothetical protein